MHDALLSDTNRTKPSDRKMHDRPSSASEATANSSASVAARQAPRVTWNGSIQLGWQVGWVNFPVSSDGVNFASIGVIAGGSRQSSLPTASHTRTH